MKELSFDSGLVTYKINGLVDVRFNPADAAFVERLYLAFDDLEEKQANYRSELEKMHDDPKAVFEFARTRDAEMRALLDDLFGVPVCEALFGDMSIYALADGLPVWMNFLLAVIDEVEATYKRQEKAQNPRIQKYTQKYAKYQKRK